MIKLFRRIDLLNGNRDELKRGENIKNRREITIIRELKKKSGFPNK